MDPDYRQFSRPKHGECFGTCFSFFVTDYDRTAFHPYPWPWCLLVCSSARLCAPCRAFPLLSQYVTLRQIWPHTYPIGDRLKFDSVEGFPRFQGNDRFAHVNRFSIVSVSLYYIAELVVFKITYLNFSRVVFDCLPELYYVAKLVVYKITYHLSHPILLAGKAKPIRPMTSKCRRQSTTCSGTR
jgi:hypothetical protein